MLLPADKIGRTLEVVFLAALTAGLLYVAIDTLHWPMMVNAPVMHYVNFLMSHGMRPYRDITDMNMPGSYAMERFGMVAFGGGNLGWRLYDFFLATVAMVSMTVIARPYNWLAGVYAGGLFAFRHISEGPWFSGEREQEMTVLLLAACALLFVSERRQWPWLAAGFGVFAGLAASIKPTLALFPVLVLPLLFYAVRRRGLRGEVYVAWAVGGLLVPLLASLFFLASYGVLGSFFFVLHSVAPLYLGMDNAGWRFLFRHAMPDEWLPLLPLALLGLVLRRTWNFERSVLLLGTVCGLISYLVQHKGFWYQRYPFLGFGLLLVSLEILEPARPRASRWVAYAGLLYATVFLIPLSAKMERVLPRSSALTDTMVADLQQMGVNRLQGEVQCFDMTFGCLHSLYKLGLVENTGFTGDMLLFPMRPNPATNFYRGMFWRLEAEHPASVIVVTSQDLISRKMYKRLVRWPAFGEYLARNYHLVVTRQFPMEDRSKGQEPVPAAYAPGYRIYVRNGSAFERVAGFARESNP